MRSGDLVEIDGVTKTAREWADFYGVPWDIVLGRASHWGDPVKALTAPYVGRKKRYEQPKKEEPEPVHEYKYVTEFVHVTSHSGHYETRKVRVK